MEEYTSISNIENKLGELFYNFENISEAAKHFNVSKEMKEKNGDKDTVNILVNICQNYLKVKNITKCRNVLESIYSALRDEDKEVKIECLLLEYRMYQIEEDLEKAEKVLLEAYNFAYQNEIQDRLAELSIVLGKFYIDLKNTEKAEQYLDRGVGIFREIGVLKN